MPYKDINIFRKYQRERAAKNRKDFLYDKSCKICGSKEKLEIDHIKRENKVSHNVWSWSLLRRNEELKKCQILCHLCHQIKTVRENTKEHCYNAYKTKRCVCSICYQHYRKVCEVYNDKRRNARLKMRSISKMRV